MSDSTSPPPPPPKLTKGQIDLIRASPIHRQIKHRVYSILGISALGFLITLLVVILGCIAAGDLLQDHRWLIFHYVLACLFAALWLVYAGIYYRDVKYAAWSDQLKIDGGWISFVVLFSSSFFFYLYYKLHTLATIDSFGDHCVFTCENDLQFVRLSPLFTGIGNILLLLIQILLLVLLFRNPIINPPLDSHGMPKPINPLTGEVMPLGKDGQPILPPELRPISTAAGDSTAIKEKNLQKVPRGTREKGVPKWESEISDASSNSDEEEKTLLEKQFSKELGRTRRRSKELGRPRRLLPSQSKRRGYDAV
ncbi:hypothetical protein JCM3765_006527 [Sporobolomyces pararoseus]